MPKSFIKRQIINEIEHYLSTDDILIIHGARQVGKTSILLYLQDHLRSKGEDTLYLDLEDSRLVNLLDRGVDDFLLYLQEQGLIQAGIEREGGKVFVLIDEIQYLENPSSFLKLLADHHRYLKIIVSGSSSFEMKSKFKDSLVGRTVSFEIFPLSFTEFLTFKNVPFQFNAIYSPEKTAELKTFFYEYLLYGGYPKLF